MNILIKNVTIVCPNNQHHLKKRDVLIEKGIYKSIGSKLTPPSKTIILDSPNTYLSLGWIDIYSNFSEPGYEHNETLNTGISAAAMGGFTEVALTPNTKPCTDNMAQVQYLKRTNELVNLHPLGAITQKTEGKNLAEMMDMHHNGAVAFTDGTHSVQDAGIMLKALLYVKSINSCLLQIPNNASLSNNTYMNEGVISTQLGIAGQPTLAETLMVHRDLELLKYTNSKLHITGVSCAESIALIKQAKTAGLQVTCSCSPHHLLFTEADLLTYNSNYKVTPPFRTAKDKNALVKAVLDGTIDAIASHHNPADWDGKNIEFEYASQGMSSIETVLQSLLKIPALAQDVTRLVELLNAGRNILNLPKPSIAIGQMANATLFSLTEKYNYTDANKKSKGINNVHLNTELKGKIIAIFNNYKHIING